MPDQPDPPDKWRVYEGDETPDPEPPVEPPAPPNVPYDNTPNVPYGQQASYNPVVITSSGSSSAAPKIILLIVALAVLGGVVAGAIAIFKSVGGIDGIAGIEAKDPDDFAEFIDKLEEEKGTTVVQQVGFYTNYIIVYMPYTDDPNDDRQISYTWRGGDNFEVWTQGTSADPTFDLAEIDPQVIDGMCDPVLALADGAVPDNCYLFLSKPSGDSKTWFRASVSDEFSRSYSIEYDKNGDEVNRTCGSEPSCPTP